MINYIATNRVIKERAIGASNYTAARLGQALHVCKEKGLPRYQVLEPLCRQEGLGVITYSSLASGFLTGEFTWIRKLLIS